MYCKILINNGKIEFLLNAKIYNALSVGGTSVFSGSQRYLVYGPQYWALFCLVKVRFACQFTYVPLVLHKYQ